MSGIGAAWHLTQKCPGKSFAILEGRGAIGGTWDLFRYPGIRSDSDMHTMGYRFRPWTNAKAIADGPSILSYIHDTAKDADVEKTIRFHHWVKRASWSTKDARWTVEAELRTPGATVPETVRYTCNFLYMCSGYYRYSAGYTPEFAGRENFKGTIAHPQLWPENLDYSGKRVIVIGSGATAVTLVPEMAKTAAQGDDAAALADLRRLAPRRRCDGQLDAQARLLYEAFAYGITRWKSIGAPRHDVLPHVAQKSRSA